MKNRTSTRVLEAVLHVVGMREAGLAGDLTDLRLLGRGDGIVGSAHRKEAAAELAALHLR